MERSQTCYLVRTVSQTLGLQNFRLEFSILTLPSTSPPPAFIAGFSQSSVGDTTPNVGGAFCDSGDPCDPHHSTCPDKFNQGRVETCHGRGPAWGDAQALSVSPTGGYDFRSNEIIAQMQADAANQILGYPTADGQNSQDGKLIDITGAVGSVKLNVDMSRYAFKLENGSDVTTCPAALGELR